ncbi:hypothetical protein GLOTRDRAFT_138033 [Gloeophyllum trabeum ATCC 11539]|uniref:Uncharacterized protein n=1 Tax=Gloeophyllum trabeum (strain ATCC 11539 / FP-39264 / Madison 617) TaxID=670483 RepID=S7RT24_GLOTA|nr:uncharacterized protein GLOTRDRAFT_138033 [Gloeophyllum trabeum ATCC 11539]EPQ56249.1 hypothetical protein GLOTRDRAFT_138033 [Gloeophyllum trabeum ATCC 11539]
MAYEQERHVIVAGETKSGATVDGHVQHASARASIASTNHVPKPGIPYEAPSTSLQADQYQDPSASYQNIDPSLQLHHSVGVAGVQHTPEVHVPHYPVQTSYQQHIPNIPPFPMHPQSHPGMMQHAEAYASLPSTSHSMMDFPMPQNQGGHYSNFSVMESDYAAQDFQGRMVSAERFG